MFVHEYQHNMDVLTLGHKGYDSILTMIACVRTCKSVKIVNVLVQVPRVY